MKRHKMVAVRWMAAYRNEESDQHLACLVASLSYELSRTDEAAFAYQEPHVRVGEGYIGLLVDTSRGMSDIKAVYSGDAWTEYTADGQLVPTRASRIKTKHPKYRGKWSYYEGNGYLEYIGVVVHRTASSKYRKMAREAAKRVGLPYLGTLR